MSYSDSQLSHPREYIFKSSRLRAAAETKTGSGRKLLIKGQGVFIFNMQNPPGAGTETTIRFAGSDENLALQLGLNRLELSYTAKGQRTVLKTESTGLIANKDAFYWISFDSHNLAFRFGVGEARPETGTFVYTFPSDYKQKLLAASEIQFDEQAVGPLRLLRDPILAAVPLVVKNTDELTMDDIAQNRVMPKANLPAIGQRLYDNVAGKRFILDDTSFPEFSKAVEYSIRTKGLSCYEILEKKRKNLPDDAKNRVYLRITMGQNGGESPGIPYVMEIWPPGCYSAIHNHAGANAIIRVLHGEIAVTLFPFLHTEESFGKAVFVTGDITWISPTLNQFHKLKNERIDQGNEEAPTCITIQCYMYDDDDSGHYNYFDYIGDDQQVHHFDPNSDMDFVAFKAKVKEEWEARPKN